MKLVSAHVDDVTTDEIINVLDRDAAIIVEGAITGATIDAILSELEPYIAGTAPFDDEFVGTRTTRTGGLVARSATVREVVLHPTVIDAARAFLTRHAKGFQLNLTQIMRLLPGQGAQRLHRDRYLWSRSLPREIEPMLNVMWALTEFTEQNGATRVIPGSQAGDWDRTPDDAEAVQAVMPRGSMLLYTGSVLHGGGENRSTEHRIGMNITYLLDWLRQEENQYLSCPPDIARDFQTDLQALIGYTTGSGGLGYYSPLQPSTGHIDTLAPEIAVGAQPQELSEHQSF